MSKRKQYGLNPETLLYEIAEDSPKERFVKVAVILVVSLALSVLYYWLWGGVLGLESPKTSILKRQNAEWSAKMEIMNRELDQCEMALKDLELRNDDIYRSIFGMNAIPQEVLNAGFGGVNRYAYLDDLSSGGLLQDSYIRIDMLTKKTYVQSKSYDEVELLSKRAGDMVDCTPAIIPIDPTPGSYRISSFFGTRLDPVYGGYRHHDGVDFATRTGNPIYATGDGVIESVTYQRFGYGNQVVIDHGFGYKTRYAHMSKIFAVEGQKVKRGECIGEVGNSGKSTGPHLHYEVHYRGKKVNPSNYFDREISPEEYYTMVQKRGEEAAAAQPTGRPVFSLRKK